MNPDVLEEIASLRRAIVRAENSIRELNLCHPCGVRSSWVSEDLAYHGERADRYRRELEILAERSE